MNLYQTPFAVLGAHQKWLVQQILLALGQEGHPDLVFVGVFKKKKKLIMLDLFAWFEF